MKTNPLKEGALTENSVGIGNVTRKMVGKRAIELAIINGRSEKEMSAADWEQAERELTGEPDIDENQAALESAPESERWDPVHGSTGSKVAESSSEDADDDGRTDSDKLVEEGIAEAEHDQMLQAAKNQRLKDEG